MIAFYEKLKVIVKNNLVFIPVFLWVIGMIIINMNLYKYGVYDFNVIKPQSLIVGTVYILLEFIFFFACQYFIDFENTENNKLVEINILNIAKSALFSFMTISILGFDFKSIVIDYKYVSLIRLILANICFFSVMASFELYKKYERCLPQKILNCVIERIKKENTDDYNSIIKYYTFNSNDNCYYKNNSIIETELYSILYKYLSKKAMISRKKSNIIVIYLFTLSIIALAIALSILVVDFLNIFLFFSYTSLLFGNIYVVYHKYLGERKFRYSTFSRGDFGHIVTEKSRINYSILLLIFLCAQQISSIYYYSNYIYPKIPYICGGGKLPEYRYLTENKEYITRPLYENETYVYIRENSEIITINKELIKSIIILNK